MKRKREDRTERRRPALEPNLAADGPSGRTAAGRRGCAALLGRVLMLMLAHVLATGLGLGETR